MRKFTFLCLIVSLLVFSSSAISQTQPHIQRQSPNLVINPDFDQSWEYDWDTLGTPVELDKTDNYNNLGTGSIKLTDPPTVRSRIRSIQKIPVTPGKTYTLSYFMKSNVWPSPIVISNVRYFETATSSEVLESERGMRFSNSALNIWEESSHFFVPLDGQNFVEINISYDEVAKGLESDPEVWIDHVYLGEGIGFDTPPSPKKAFDGSMVKVDSLGNFEIIDENGEWQQFFPLCIYADNNRADWSDYKDAGFNCNMRSATASSVQRAKNAGLKSGFSLTQFIGDTLNTYNDLALLRERLDELADPVQQNIDPDIMKNVFTYYWDNEHYDEWDVPLAVSNIVKDEYGETHPIYALQGQFGLTRRYNNQIAEIVDVTGSYTLQTFIENDSVMRGSDPGAHSLVVQENISGQIAPVSFAQINFGIGERMKANLFTSIAKGARAMGHWRDCVLHNPNCPLEGAVTPIEDRAWFADMPEIANEINSLSDLIRQPHWTDWAVENTGDAIEFGTRELESKGYLVIANETDSLKTPVFDISDIGYTPLTFQNAYTKKFVANINSESVSVEMEAYDAGFYLLGKDIEDALVLDLKFNGDTQDDSAFSNHGALVDGAEITNNLLNLENNSGYLSVPTDNSIEMNQIDLTIFARVKISPSQTGFAGIVTKGAASPTDTGYKFSYHTNSGQLRLWLGNGIDRLYLNSNAGLGLNDGEWHTLAVSVNRDGEADFYVDGENVGSELASPYKGDDIISESRDLLVGSWIGAHKLDGQIDSVRAYKSALSSAIVERLSKNVFQIGTKMDISEPYEDLSLFGNDAATHGDIAWSSPNYTLDGSGDFLSVAVSESTEIGTSDLTIAASIKIDESQTGFAGIVTKGAATPTDAGYKFSYQVNSGQLRLFLGDGNTRVHLNSYSNLNLNDGSWHDVAVTLDRNSDAIFYLDGEFVGSESALQMQDISLDNSGRELLVGSWIGAHFLNGEISNIYLDKRVLDIEEIIEICRYCDMSN